MSNRHGYILLGIVICFLAGAQLASKFAQPYLLRPKSLAVAELANMLVKNLMVPWVIVFLGCTFFAGLLWLLVIKMLPLSRAYPLLSLNFFFVAVLSRVLFGEQISFVSFVGISFIVVGTLLLRLPGGSADSQISVRGATRDTSLVPKATKQSKNMEL